MVVLGRRASLGARIGDQIRPLRATRRRRTDEADGTQGNDHQQATLRAAHLQQLEP